MKQLTVLSTSLLVALVFFSTNVHADDLSKIKLSCNTSSVAKTVGESLVRNIRSTLQGLGSSFSDKQSAQAKIKYKLVSRAAKAEVPVTDYLNQGLSLAGTPSLQAPSVPGENGVISFGLNASSIGSGAVLGRTCSESYKFTVGVSMRITDQQTGKRTRYSGSVTTAPTSVAGFYQSGK